MQPQEHFSNQPLTAITCSQCGSAMPTDMRFCRSCGNRLGEGSAEYTETVRFGDAPTAPNVRGTTPFIHSAGGPLVIGETSGVKPKRRLSGMAWVGIILAIFFCFGGVISALKGLRRNAPSATVAAPRSYFGVNGFKSVDGGASFDSVEPPGSPADKAGLVGGDVITMFDGHPVTDDDEMMFLLKGTPPGKLVEVMYLRDGELKKAQVTTVSREQSSELEELFANRPIGQGFLGFDDDDSKTVVVEGTNIRGVRLRDVNPNGPAAMSGMQDGDVVTEFDKVPIRTVRELVFRVRRATPYSTVPVTVMRGTEKLDIQLKVGKRS